MPERSAKSTTIRVSRAVRDEINALAAIEHVTLDEMLRRLARAERQRRIGAELAAQEPTRTERTIIAAGLTAAGRHAGR
jgi:hypothetical protein